MVDIAGPNRQASFAGTQSIGRGVQGPSQVGLVGMNVLANAQQRNASKEFQKQLLRQQEMQKLLAQADDRREALKAGGELFVSSGAPASDESADIVASQLSGLDRPSRMLLQNAAGSQANLNQQRADVQNTASSTVSNLSDAGFRGPQQLSPQMLRDGDLSFLFNPQAVGQDQGLTGAQQLEQSRLDALYKNPVTKTVDAVGPNNQVTTLKGPVQGVDRILQGNQYSISDGNGGAGANPGGGADPGGSTAPDGFTSAQMDTLEKLEQAQMRGEFGNGQVLFDQKQLLPNGVMRVPVQDFPEQGQTVYVDYSPKRGRRLQVVDEDGEPING